MDTKKITLATFKKFIKDMDGLYINVTSSFDGMTDCCESIRDGFQKARAADHVYPNNLDIEGVWCVLQSRDWFYPYSDSTLSGIRVSNSCGAFIVARKI